MKSLFGIYYWGSLVPCFAAGCWPAAVLSSRIIRCVRKHEPHHRTSPVFDFI